MQECCASNNAYLTCEELKVAAKACCQIYIYASP